MNELIINAPQLQSVYKRVANTIIWATGWLLWLYLLFPALTVISWQLGEHALVNQIRWFGDYNSLLDLLEMYAATLLALAAAWLAWVAYHSLRNPLMPAKVHKIVNDQHLCAFYQIRADELPKCRCSQITSVYFDEQGQIIKLDATIYGNSLKPVPPLATESV
jgi:poly-beta-1,6-N-acetyl-D-glucosamine biosynthesis protein PgaD